ncbi:hypothetical protein R1sor_025677 [Riccia sorocarpa]|uniref:VWFA domain-containing protein n=1 Tax=Riccia sorocarpa TaxID=122646 RepID=A0ABD3GD73_9MARC
MFPSRALALSLVFWALLEWDQADGHAHKAMTSWRSLLQVPSNADDGDFVKGVEDSIISLAESVLVNYRGRQGLWESGNCITSCSVSSCQTKQLNNKNVNASQCLVLPADSTLLSDQPCKVSDGNVTRCNKALLSTESYVRVPGGGQLDLTKISPDQQLTICSQKNLDKIFPTIYTNTSTTPFDKLVWSRFGAANGVYRVYPGLELGTTLCGKSYDPRKRPWYRATTGVSKQVVILLDGGGSMLKSISLTGTDSLFNATTRIVNEFLDTLNKDDTVSVYEFGHTGLAQTDYVKDVRMPDPSNGTAVTSVFAPLKAALKHMSDSITSDAPQANLTAALEDLLVSNDTVFDTPSSQSLKVLLIFTRGQLADGTSISVPSNSSIAQALTSLPVRPFIYQWKDQSDDSADTDLQSVACALNASYNAIFRSDSAVNDPLSALQSFYSYVAKIRHEGNNGKPLWIHSYDPFTAVGGDLVGVSYPVFDGDVLVGVASIDVLRSAIGQYNVKTDDEIVQLPGPTLNCSANLKESYVPNPSFASSTSGGLCPGGNLPASQYGDRTCCDNQCSVAISRPGTKFPGGATAGIAVGGCLLLAALVCLLCFRKTILKFFGSCKECMNKRTRSGEVVHHGTYATSAHAVNSHEEIFGKVIG